MSAGEGEDVSSGVDRSSAPTSSASEPSPAPIVKRGVLLRNNSTFRKAWFKRSKILYPGCTMRVSKKAAKEVEGITWIEVVVDE